MRIDDRLVKMNQDKLKKQKRRQQLDEDEETLTYATRPMMRDLNKEKGKFDGGFQGINTAESVFDRTAIFRTDTPASGS